MGYNSDIKLANLDNTLTSRLAAINSIQRGTIAPSGATSATATISYVTTTRAFCNYNGVSTSTTDVRYATARVYLANSTQVVAAFGIDPAGQSTAAYEVIEFGA